MGKNLTKFLVLISSLTLSLCACADDGIGIAPGNHNFDSTMGDSMDEPNDSGGVTNGGTSATIKKDEENPDEIIEKEEITTNTGMDEDIVINNGTNIVVFELSYLGSTEDGYVYLSYESDALDKKYNFSFYTINNNNFDAESIQKEEYNGQQAYRVKIGDINSGKYSIKFYDENAEQYGRGDFSIKLPSKISSSNFIAVGVTLVSVTATTIFLNVVNAFKKIGNFISSIFSGGGNVRMTN